MSTIHWEIKEIEIPKNAHINHSDGRVYIYVEEGKAARYSRRKVIGHATSATTMHPNDFFKTIYPDLWEESYGSKGLATPQLKYGMYAICLASSIQNGLYDTLLSIYEPKYANVLMDYSMFSILSQSNSSVNFYDCMKNEIVFSKDKFNDSWLSEFFKKDITEDQAAFFKTLWMEKCKENGVKDAYICLDGFNSDCQSAEQGYLESGTNNNIVSYMYAVSSEDGTPITYSLYNGSKVDSKAFLEMIVQLSSHDIEIKGVILDGGFATAEVFKTLKNLNYPYVVMLKENSSGHKEMFEKYASTIKWNLSYVVNNKGLFGISEKHRIFNTSSEEAYINLFYDAANGNDRSLTLLEKVMNEKTRIDEELKNNKKPTIKPELSKHFNIQAINDQSTEIIFNYDDWQKATEEKGFASIATSENLPLDEVDRIYHLRDAVETNFAQLKTSLEYDVSRVYATESVKNKYLACFVASILRTSLMNLTLELKDDTNRLIKEIDSVYLSYVSEGFYFAVHDQSAAVKRAFESVGITRETLDALAGDVNNRLSNSVVSQVRTIPVILTSEQRKKMGRPKKVKTEEPPKEKKKMGRPKGSGKKKSVESTEIRKPGRPKGSKNKSKTENSLG